MAAAGKAFGSVRCVVFDLDDTLWNTIQTLERAHECMVQALEAKHPELAAKCSTAFFKEELKKTMAEFPEQAHDFTFLRKTSLRRVTGRQDITDEAYGTWFQARNSPELFPGAADALKRLKAGGLLIGTLTDGNSNPRKIPGIGDVADFFVSASEAGAAKPDPRTFALCVERAGCAPEEMVMVGDNVEKDILGAKNAGWRAIWVRPPKKDPIAGSSHDLGAEPAKKKSNVSDEDSGAAVEKDVGADAVVDHVQEVESVLKGWATG